MGKLNKVTLIKFNTDRSIKIIAAPVDKSIISDSKEGFIARNSAFTEIIKDRFFGFIKGNQDQIKGSFIVREAAPDPLEFRVEDGVGKIYGEDFTPDDLVYHEDESFTRSTADIEVKGSTEPDFIQKAMVYAVLGEVGAVLILVIAVGLPEALKRFGF